MTGEREMPADARGNRVVFVAHCLLNQNAKVRGLAGTPGIVAPLVEVLLRTGVGVVQLPCPEVAEYGPGRPLGNDTRDQYDHPAYHRTCHAIAEEAAKLARAHLEDGCRVVACLGVEGSPSCSVHRVPLSEGGARVLRPGVGLFVEALGAAFVRHGLDVPFLGIPECPEAGDLASALARLESLIAACYS